MSAEPMPAIAVHAHVVTQQQDARGASMQRQVERGITRIRSGMNQVRLGRQSRRPGIGHQAVDAPLGRINFAAVFFPLDVLGPALAGEAGLDLLTVHFPPAIIGRPQVIGVRQQPPAIVDDYGFVADFLERFGVFLRAAGAGRDDADLFEGASFFLFAGAGFFFAQPSSMATRARSVPSGISSPTFQSRG